MNESDRVSIIIPIYNSEIFLRRCVNSVLMQTYENIEIILVNDGSTDKSQQICIEYQEKDDRIKVINKCNGGLSDARNVGIDSATGNYIYLLDSDDYIDSNCIETMILFARENSCDMVISDGIYESDSGIKEYKNKALNGHDLILNPQEAFKVLLEHKGLIGSPWTAWGKLYKRKLFKDIRYPVGRVSEDLATTPKLMITSSRIGYISNKSYHYVLREGSLIHQGSEKMICDNYIYLKELRCLVYDNYTALKRTMDVEFLWMSLLIGLSPQCSYENVLKDILAEIRKKICVFCFSDRNIKYKIIISTFAIMPLFVKKLVVFKNSYKN